MRLLRHLTLFTLVFIAWPAPAQQYPARPIHDFTPIARIGGSPNVLVINPRVPANSMRHDQ